MRAGGGRRRRSGVDGSGNRNESGRGLGISAAATYRLIAGERRLRAAQQAELEEIPAVVRAVDEETAGLDLALLENIARADLNPLDEARAFARLIESGLTRKGVAERLSVPQKRVTERLQVLELPEVLHERVADGAIPPGAIRALVSLGKVPASCRRSRWPRSTPVPRARGMSR